MEKTAPYLFLLIIHGVSNGRSSSNGRVEKSVRVVIKDQLVEEGGRGLYGRPEIGSSKDANILGKE